LQGVITCKKIIVNSISTIIINFLILLGLENNPSYFSFRSLNAP